MNRLLKPTIFSKPRGLNFIGCIAFIYLSVSTAIPLVAETTIVAFGDSTTATRGQLNIYAKRLAAAPPLRPFGIKIIRPLTGTFDKLHKVGYADIGLV